MVKYLIPFLLITIFLVGCASRPSNYTETSETGDDLNSSLINNTQDSNDSEHINYTFLPIHYTAGLRAYFVPGNPPDTIYDNGQSAFSITIRMENLGEYNIPAGEGYVRIRGIDPSSYGVSNLQANFPREIKGTRRNPDGQTIMGMTDTIDFTGLKYLPVVQGSMQQTVWADICYRYSTKIKGELCVNSGTRACEGEKELQNSFAPIHITSLYESIPEPGKINISIKISHIGPGDAFFDDRASICNDINSNPERSKIHFQIFPLSIGGILVTPKCTGLTGANTAGNEGYIRLYSNGIGKEEMTLHCTLDIGNSEVSGAPLDIELTYKYLQHLETTLTASSKN